VLADTGNVYSIQLFTDRGEFSFDGNSLTRDFQKFVDFYGTIACCHLAKNQLLHLLQILTSYPQLSAGSESYADDIITAAFEGKATSFSTGKDLDMSNYDFEARAGMIILN
jgi:hypothetical protein